MARTARLGRTVIALTLVVLLAHWAALAWLASHWQQPSVLRPMAPLMLTREIVPKAPTPAPVLERKVAKTFVARSHDASKSIVIEAAATPRSRIAVAKPAVALTPPPVAAAPPEPAASAADAASSTPTAASSVATAPQTPASAQAGTDSIKPLDDSANPNAVTNYLDIWPDDTRLTYLLSGNYRGALHGDAQVLWQRQGDQYQSRIEVDLGWLFSMTMTSQGTITPPGLFPRVYEELVRGRRRDIVLDDHSISLPNGKQVARPQGVQDTISQFIELAYQFNTGQTALQVGHSFDLWLARPGGVDLWTYDVPEEVIVPTPRLGQVQAFHIKPRPPASASGNITVEMWFAPSLQYLPVRIRLNLGDGTTYMDLIVDKIEQR